MRALLFIGALIFSAPAHAQSAGIRVSPVLIELNARSMGSLRIANGRAREASFEMIAYAWTQEGGEDVVAPTQSLLIAPRIFAIAPGREQIVRLALAPEARGGAREQAFRLLMRELPPPTRPETQGPRLVLEMSMPVFATPPNASPSLHARRITIAGRPMLALSNRGSARAAFTQQTPGLPRYLLAGAEALAPFNDESVRIRYAGPRDTNVREEDFSLAPAPVADLN
ncbi:MAG: molecular chaperone [Hyphomonadaceae bacterium]